MQAPINYGLGAAFSVLYMVLMILLLIGYRRAVRYSDRFSTVTGKGYRPRVISLGRWRHAALGIFVVYFLLTVAAPFAILLWASLLPSNRIPSMQFLSLVSLRNYAEVFSQPGIFSVIWNTLSLMAICATATMVLAFVVSWVIVRTPVRGRAFLDTFLFLPNAIPGIVVALALVMAYLTPPLNQLRIYGTVWIVAMALIAGYIAFATRLMNTAIVQIHKELEHAAYVCGATVTRTLFAITLPLLFPAFAAGWVWVAVHTLRAFSAPLMLASKGNQVFAILMWEYWEAGEVPMASSLGVLLILVLIPLTLFMRGFIVRVSGQQN